MHEVGSQNPTVATPVGVLNDENLKSVILRAIEITVICSPYIRNPMLVKHVAIAIVATKRLGLQMAILMLSKSLTFKYK
jgi:hypothetical protein